MEHLDEGLAHAWIDGELSAEEATAWDAHVRACAACASVVAEARGFIAATSRIVAQLDHVPSGVIPVAPAAARTPVLQTPTTDSHAARRATARAKRAWWRHPALAVAAVLSVTTLGWLSLRGDAPSVATLPAPRTPTADVVSVPPVDVSASAAAPRTESKAARAQQNAARAARMDSIAAGAAAGAPVVAATERRQLDGRTSRVRAMADAATNTDVAKMRAPSGVLGATSGATSRAVPAAAAPASATAIAIPAPAQAPQSAGMSAAQAAGRSAEPSALAAPLRSTVAAKRAEQAERASLAGCYTLARAPNASVAATMQLPSRIRLTDSVRVINGPAAIFLAFGARDDATAEMPLQYRRDGATAILLSPFSGAPFNDAAFVRVLVVPAEAERGASGDNATFVARPRACP